MATLYLLPAKWSELGMAAGQGGGAGRVQTDARSSEFPHHGVNVACIRDEGDKGVRVG